MQKKWHYSWSNQQFIEIIYFNLMIKQLKFSNFKTAENNLNI